MSGTLAQNLTACTVHHLARKTVLKGCASKYYITGTQIPPSAAVSRWWKYYLDKPRKPYDLTLWETSVSVPSEDAGLPMSCQAEKVGWQLAIVVSLFRLSFLCRHCCYVSPPQLASSSNTFLLSCTLFRHFPSPCFVLQYFSRRRIRATFFFLHTLGAASSFCCLVV